MKQTAADAILSETRALLGMPMKFTTGSKRPGLFGKRVSRWNGRAPTTAEWKILAAVKVGPGQHAEDVIDAALAEHRAKANSNQCRKCGAGRASLTAPCGVCETKPAAARLAVQQPAKAIPAAKPAIPLMTRAAFDKLTTAQQAHYCKSKGQLRD